jgi:glycosyltransferase involved in cell wall biosynthesis
VPNLTCTTVGLGVPIVGILHDLRHLRRPSEFSRASRLFRRVVWTASSRRMAAIASVSEFSLSEADDLGFRLPAERAVIPHGLDHVRRDTRTDAKKNTVVCVGHRNSKGLHALPAVWAEMQANIGINCPMLFITGVARDRQPELTRAMTAAGVVNDFCINEFLPESDLHRMIAEARAVLYLSAYEGYGLVPSEATALGTHSFVYDLAPYRERAAQLSITAVPVGNTGALVRALTGFLRAEPVAVVTDRLPRWSDAADAYHDLAERALLRARRYST